MPVFIFQRKGTLLGGKSRAYYSYILKAMDIKAAKIVHPIKIFIHEYKHLHLIINIIDILILMTQFSLATNLSVIIFLIFFSYKFFFGSLI